MANEPKTPTVSAEVSALDSPKAEDRPGPFDEPAIETTRLATLLELQGQGDEPVDTGATPPPVAAAAAAPLGNPNFALDPKPYDPTKPMSDDDIARTILWAQQQKAKSRPGMPPIAVNTAPPARYTTAQYEAFENEWTQSPNYGVYVCEEHVGHMVKLYQCKPERDEHNIMRSRNNVIIEAELQTMRQGELPVGVLNLTRCAAVVNQVHELSFLCKKMEQTSFYPMFIMRWTDYERVRKLRYIAEQALIEAKEAATELASRRLMKAGRQGPGVQPVPAVLGAQTLVGAGVG